MVMADRIQAKNFDKKVTVDGRTSRGVNIKARRSIAYVCLIFVSIMCLIWIWMLFVNATRSNGELTSGFRPFPSNYLLINWRNLTSSTLPIMNGLINSLIVAFGSAILCSYFATLAAYGFHIYHFQGKKMLFMTILLLMMIPQQVGALGLVQLLEKMHLSDSLLALMLPRMAVPVTFYYIIQYMKSTLPTSLIEAARIDGASEMRIFHQIAFPLVKPAVVVQFIFAFVISWNHYFTPALILHSNEKKTLPILIAQLRSSNFVDMDKGQIYVMILFSILPVVIVYLFLSKLIIQGVTMGSEKG